MSVLSVEALAPFFAKIQKECLPGVWSKGVGLCRDGTVQKDLVSKDEIVLRILLKGRPVSPKITFWPEDEDSFCDCGDRNEICAHIAACVIALRSGKALELSSAPVLSDDSRRMPPPSGLAPRLGYRFMRKKDGLEFDRVLSYPEREVSLTETLVAYIGGISSGRIASPPLLATREDLAVDSIFPTPRRGQPDRVLAKRLLTALAPCSGITLDGLPITTSGKLTGIKAQLIDAKEGGFRLQGEMDDSITEVFSNGIALCGTQLRPLESPLLSPLEQEAVSRAGKLFRTSHEIAALISEVLPSLQKKIEIDIRTQRLPQARLGTPRISLRLDTQSETSLLVVPSIDYPMSGEAETLTPPRVILVPNPGAEHALARKLQAELHLRPGQPLTLTGRAAVDFVARVQARDAEWDLQGEGLIHFSVQGTLQPRIQASDSAFSLEFELATSPGSAQTAKADRARVFQAWKDGTELVPLLGGGWAKLPTGWLSQYGARAQALLLAQTARGSAESSRGLPAHLLPELVSLVEELGEKIPARLKAMIAQLEHHEQIPQAALPADLRAELRQYQLDGVNWLCFLRDSGMGALLADDMGLGKTLQALCAIRGRTLVILPTSVLSAWTGQIEKFRPALRVSTYYGPGRKLDSQADITLTTYAVLRLDRELLIAENWDTLILDEAQIIKNPDSQVARAAHSFQGGFRIALSGTPIENRLDDLWSQFQFVNPGLLGSRSEFQEQLSIPISRGEPQAGHRLRAKIRPFLLRRLKKEVAPELPPRTEIVLHCELSDSERELYESLLAAGRREVLQKLEQGASVFAALELLLRLRQACCHPALVPGSQAIVSHSVSAKLTLLLETLGESIALGHRALVFSQWTSYLDLIEPRLQAAGHGFVRLDGTTRDREAVVRGFQDPNGPPVMLISLKAGVGLTLTAADHIFIMDPWWNPAVEDQAADRAHRIGQVNPVLIHRLVAKNTVEDRILELQKRKIEVAGSVLSDRGGALNLTQDDIMALLD